MIKNLKTALLLAGVSLFWVVSPVCAQEPVSHYSQYTSVIGILTDTTKIVALQEQIIEERKKINEAIGTLKNNFMPEMTKLGNELTENRLLALQQLKGGIGGNGSAGVTFNEDLILKAGEDYTDEQLKKIFDTQNQTLVDLGVAGIEHAMTITQIASDDGAKAIDVSALVASVRETNNHQDAFRTLTSSDRQALGNQLMLLATDARIAGVRAMRLLQELSVVNRTEQESKEDGTSAAADMNDGLRAIPGVKEAV